MRSPHLRFPMRLPAIAAAVALLLSLFAPPAAASGAGARLEGRVVGPDSAPLAGASVLLDGAPRARTDAAGRFALDVAPAAHRLEIRLAGYRTLRRELAAEDLAGELRIVLEPAARFAGEIVVEALRAAERAPYAVSEITPERLETLDYGQEMPRLLAATPSIAAYSESGLAVGGGYSYFTLRGLSQARINMTFDGVPLNDPEESAVYFANFGGFTGALSRVQVQRGVGTSSVGAPSYGGAIHFESADIADERSLGVELLAGAYGTGGASAVWQSGRSPSGLAFYARGAYQETDGWREHSGIDQRSLFFGADWRGEETYARLFGFAGREESSLAFYAVEPEVLARNPRANPMRPEERDAFGQDLLYLLVGRALSERAEVAAQLYYSGARGSLELFDDPAAGVGLTEYGIDGQTLGALATARMRGARWRFDAGLHGSRFFRDHYAFAESGERLYANVGRKQEVSGFGKLAFDAAPRVTLFADLQLRRAEFRYEGTVDLGPVAWSFVNPRLGARFDAGERLSFHASVGRSGREPARNDLLEGQDEVDVAIDLERVRPEEVVDYELGLDWRQERFELALGLYAMEFEDEIAATGELSDFGYPIRRNLPESSRRGIELEAAFAPTERWRFRLTANLARNRIDTWRQALDVYGADGEWLGQQLVTVRDVEPALSPETILGASAAWRAGAGLRLELSGRYVDAAQLDNLGTSELVAPSYAWFDLALGWQLARWLPAGDPRFTLRVENLFDEERAWPSGYSYPFLVADGAGGARLDGIPYFYPLAPRHVVARLELRF